jgi:hypothetical protein
MDVFEGEIRMAKELSIEGVPPDKRYMSHYVLQPDRSDPVISAMTKMGAYEWLPIADDRDAE